MEPGPEDREDAGTFVTPKSTRTLPRWSPVLETGETGAAPAQRILARRAAMGPGPGDREGPATLASLSG